MNRKLLVSLLRKDIQELDMITEGFMEMNEYPKSIILLAQRKTEDIQAYIKQLSDLKAESATIDSSVTGQKVSASVEAAVVVEPIIVSNPEREVPDTQESASESIELEVIPAIQIGEETIEPTIKEPTQEPIVQQDSKSVVDDLPRTILDEKKVIVAPSRNETLSKTENSLGSILANKKIDDIKQAISIGDRFRFQRELFNSNGEEMNKTLNYINQLATFAEVQSFLESKYKWAEENEAVEHFYQIARRRFL